ncbi:Fasciclin-like arabinogalactan protein 19 [Acorus calamus]|uniref:Fasciclin-like arabinogalactan protein 19 n=1 Tax=Acorus calamus TaxID=4465 RepID=A0AAV9EBA1_ACOCL|nr:Fasciclin-like arabinogalactan protein 19 [Acorus calamus]
MAKILPLLILSLTLSNSLTPLTSISHTDFDQMLSALRSNGYNLICNAISASDIRLRLLSPNSSSFGGGGSFTLFAPTDSSLFAVDMASASASDYVRSLRLHVALRRLSSDDLRSVSAASSVPTLLHGHLISLSRQEGDPGEVSVAVERRQSRPPRDLGRARRRRPRPRGDPQPPPCVRSADANACAGVLRTGG